MDIRTVSINDYVIFQVYSNLFASNFLASGFIPDRYL